MIYALKLIEVPEGTPTTLIGKVLKLKSLPATVGRGQDASLVIQHRKLSRLHCRFYLADASLHVRDLGSTNGTAVNGVLALGAQSLHVGDHVSLGGVVFQVGQWVDSANGGGPAANSGGAVASDATPPTTLVPPGGTAPAARPFAGEETVDWMVETPAPQTTATGSTETEVPAADPPTADTSRLTTVRSASADWNSDSAVRWEGLPAVEPVSHVHIDSSFVAKAGTADPSLLPHIGPTHPTELDPEALDLADIAEAKKDASVSALGNFFSQQNLKRS